MCHKFNNAAGIILKVKSVSDPIFARTILVSFDTVEMNQFNTKSFYLDKGEWSIKGVIL